ncbi:MAG TPA: hypothetical protein VFA20_06965 [Myxococcaceae bacterium]|nr:hypothetical protein [Myxococcaceae bacterium]
MRAWLAGMVGAAIAAGCSGPAAPDDAVCRDLIHRLCAPEPCFVAIGALDLGLECEADLLARTRCSEADFTFPDPPGRDRVLQCRLPLLRAGLEADQHPDCADVADMVDFCPDVVDWLKETPP